MSADEFRKLFKYMSERFDAMDKRFNKLEKGLADVNGKISELCSRVEGYRQEMVIYFHQSDRRFDNHKMAILQTAKASGVKLKVEL